MKNTERESKAKRQCAAVQRAIVESIPGFK